MFSVWPKIQPKTTEIIFSRYFHFKAFPPLSHTHESLTHALPLSNLHCSDPHTEPNGTIHTDAPWSRSRRSPELRRSTSITIAIAIIEIGEIAIAISPISREALIAIVIDVDQCSSSDRRDRDRGASVWIVPFGSVCGSEQWRFYRGSACVRDSCVWERGGKALKWK